MALRFTQTKTLFLATQALLSDLRSKAFSSVSNTLFLALQALSTDLRSAASSTVSMALKLLCVWSLKDACYVLQQTHGQKNNLLLASIIGLQVFSVRKEHLTQHFRCARYD